MSPAPSRQHQDISREIEMQIATYLKGKQCTVYDAPFDVRFPDYPDQPDDAITTVVQPDILVVCDKSKLDKRGMRGAPDWIIEILSPATSLHDLTAKYALYEKSGVKEYWIVDPANMIATVYLLQNNAYIRTGVYGKDDTIQSTIFEDFSVNMGEVFVDFE
jgi:Uma2 family endonuclease